MPKEIESILEGDMKLHPKLLHHLPDIESATTHPAIAPIFSVRTLAL